MYHMVSKEKIEELRKALKESAIHPRDQRLLEPYEMFGIECDKGWESLYRPIMKWIEKYNEEHPDSVITITQIKEKFGGLRFYWSADNITKEDEDKLHEMVRDAEADSYNVCETCGTRENVGITVGGWYRTICLDCLQKLLANPQYYKVEDRWKKNDDGQVYVVTEDSIEKWEK